MTREPNPYESPQLNEPATPRPKSTGDAHPEFFALVILQLLLTGLLSPADGGRWFRYTVIYLVLFDIAVYFAFVSCKPNRHGFWIAGGFWLMLASIAVAVFGTSVTEYFQFP